MHPIRTCRITAFLDEGILVKNIHDEKIIQLTNVNIPKHAAVGDLIRWCEHNFYDVVDEKGNLLYREV